MITSVHSGYIWEKAKRKIRGRIVRWLYGKKVYPFLYLSYWHSLLVKSKSTDISYLFYAARPNPGAGIGHQMANWIAGYWYAKQFGLKFAHLPFASKEWERFLGFGIGEITVAELKGKGYILRRMPMFDENSHEEIEIQRRIISSYAGRKVVLVAEQDQFYRDQFGVMPNIQRKFFSAPSRKSDQLIYDKCNFNIAIHIRRGDIMSDPKNENLKIRFLSNDYYYIVLKQILNRVNTEKPVHIFFFSQGCSEEYPEFKEFRNLHWCFDMCAQDSFLHMVYADLLITSKSSFSYKPALLNRGIKVCPKNFWHGYPKTEDWILFDDDGKK